MSNIVLARVDERLIHGQVMTNLSKTAGATHIFIVDDVTSQDDFMKLIFENAGSRTGLQVEIYSVEEALSYWNESKFDSKKVILLTKTIESMYELIKGGLVVDDLNIGGVSKKENSTYIIKAVSITKEQGELLEEIQDTFDINVYFQDVPSAAKVNLKEGLKKIK